MKTKSPLPFVIVAIAVLAGLFWWLRPAPDETVPAAPMSPASASLSEPESTPASAAPAVAPTPPSRDRAFEFVVEHRRLASAPTGLTIVQGGTVTLRVRSDVADELHLHGYDLESRLRPGETATLTFVADRSGRFPLELHHARLELGALEVLPSP